MAAMPAAMRAKARDRRDILTSDLLGPLTATPDQPIPAMTHLAPPIGATCLFNSTGYARALTHVGSPRSHAASGVTLLARPVPDGSCRDGVGPWPYLWLDEAGEHALRDEFRDLVTVTAVSQPGYVPRHDHGDVRLLKQHYLYDPALPRPPLSRRATRRLTECRAAAEFELVDDATGRSQVSAFYRALVRRRRLSGGFFDLPDEHFESLAADPGVLFVRVRAGRRVGAMACAVRVADRLQVLHIVPTTDGLAWNASYLLLAGLQDLADAFGFPVLFGGLPVNASPGLRIFKERWSNRTEPVYLFQVINDHQTFARLTRGVVQRDFFPPYRSAP